MSTTMLNLEEILKAQTRARSYHFASEHFALVLCSSNVVLQDHDSVERSCYESISTGIIGAVNDVRKCDLSGAINPEQPPYWMTWNRGLSLVLHDVLTWFISGERGHLPSFHDQVERLNTDIMSFNKLSIAAVDCKGKRILIR